MPTSQTLDGDYSASTSTPTTPKQQLLGQTLASGWRLDQILKATRNSSGGNFGTGYIASRGEEIAFVKAVDFVDALKSDDPMTHLSKLIAESNFEKDVLQYCTERGMNRVLRYIGHEYVGSGADPLNRVSCLIMEAGDQDLRRLINNAGTSTCSWSLFALHDVIKAVVQLHKGGIAHQDVKPSNVIAVREDPTKAAAGSTPMKIGDLGRVVRQNGLSPFNGSTWSGDRRYAPPERWYGFVPANWNDAREASDAYMLGSLLIYLFTGIPVQSLLWQKIPASFQPVNWGGSYDTDLIPVLLHSTSLIIEENLRPMLQNEIADEVIDVAKALLHPDPSVRGDMKARRQIGRPVGLDRIQQRIQIIAMRCAAIERGRKST